MTQLLNDDDLRIELFNNRYRVTKLLSGTAGVDGRFQVITFEGYDMLRILKTLLPCDEVSE